MNSKQIGKAFVGLVIAALVISALYAAFSESMEPVPGIMGAAGFEGGTPLPAGVVLQQPGVMQEPQSVSTMPGSDVSPGFPLENPVTAPFGAMSDFDLVIPRNEQANVNMPEDELVNHNYLSSDESVIGVSALTNRKIPNLQLRDDPSIPFTLETPFMNPTITPLDAPSFTTQTFA